MKTVTKISSLLILILLMQSCLPDSLDKWNEDSSGDTSGGVIVTPIDPPSNLSYTGSPYVFAPDVAITPLNPTVTISDPTYPILYYSISPSLPSGLEFNNLYGIIAGALEDYSANTIYTIEAHNAGGSDSTTIQISALPTAQTYFYYGTDASDNVHRFDKDLPITTLTPTIDGSTNTFLLSDNLESDSGLEFDDSTGIISGTPTKLITKQLAGSVTVAAGGVAVTGVNTLFTDELMIGSNLIMGQYLCQGSKLCVVATITNDTSLTLETAVTTAPIVTPINVTQLGKNYTIVAATYTESPLGTTISKTINIGINPDSLSNFQYPASNVTVAREKSVPSISPITLSGESPSFSIVNGSGTDIEEQFEIETGLDFDPITGEISGTPAPASYIYITNITDAEIADVSALCTTAVPGPPMVSCTGAGGTAFTCDDWIKTEISTTPITTAYIHGICVRPVNVNYIYLAIDDPLKTNPLDAAAGGETLTDSESLGLNFTTGAGDVIVDTDFDYVSAATQVYHGYLNSKPYTFRATDSFGVTDDFVITLSVIKTAPSNLSYGGSTFNLTKDVAISPLSPDFDGDVFNSTYSITPDLESIIMGLTFDDSEVGDSDTGIISGLPTQTSSGVTYTITVTNDASATATNINLGVYDNLTTSMKYTQSRTIKIRIGNLSGVLAAEVDFSIPAIAGVQTYGTIDSIDASGEYITITKQSTDANDIVNVGDSIEFDTNETGTVLEVTNIYKAGETINLLPSGITDDSTINFTSDNEDFTGWATATGALSGTMTSDFIKQSFSIYASNPVSQTNIVSFAIAGVSEDPKYLNYSNLVQLSVADTTSFRIGGVITGDDGVGNSASGIVLKVEQNEYLLLVKVNEGKFTDQMSIDNADPFFSEETTCSNFYILNVSALLGFTQGGYVTSSNGAIGIIRHIDTNNNRLYIYVTSGAFAPADTIDDVFPYNGATTTTIESATNNGVIQDKAVKYVSTIVDLTAAASSDNFEIGGYISQSANDIGIVTYIDRDTEEIYTRIVKGSFEGSTAVDNAETWAAATYAVDMIISKNLTLTLTGGGLSLSEAGDITTSASEIGMVHQVNNATSVDVSTTTGTFDTAAVTVYSDNPGTTAIGGTISTVTHNNAFYFYARKPAVIAPTVNMGDMNDVTYSISPTLLPNGMSFNSTTGTISGTPIGAFPEQGYTVTATSTIDTSVTIQFSFYLKVYDYVELTNHTSGAASYILHKEGQSNNTAPCRIMAQNLDADDFPTVMCRLEAGELDLNQLGLTLGTNVGTGICNHVQFVPFYYNRYEYQKTDETAPANVYVRYDAAGDCSTACRGSHPFSDNYLPDDCPDTAALAGGSFGTWYSLDEIIAAGAVTEADPTTACTGDYGDSYANCDDGSYIRRTVTCTESAAAPTNCDCVVADETRDCGGTELECKDGPAIGFGTNPQRPDKGRTQSAFLNGLAITDWTFAAPATKNPFELNNLSLANYTNTNTCGKGTYEYYWYSWLGYSNRVGAANPFKKSSSTMYGYINPYYTLNCLDESNNIKGRILLQVRDWDRSFDVEDDIDEIIPGSLMDNNGSSVHYDWDFYLAPTDPPPPPYLPGIIVQGQYVDGTGTNCGAATALTGNGTTVLNSNIVTGAGTAFISEYAVGDAITIVGVTWRGKSYSIVKSIIDDDLLYTETDADIAVAGAVGILAPPGLIQGTSTFHMLPTTEQ